MFKSINYLDLMYVDIETAGITKTYDELPEPVKEAWEYYCTRNNLVNDVTPIELDKAWQDNVALVPEFSTIVCVSIGEFKTADGGTSFNTQTYHIGDKSEKDMLLAVKAHLDKSLKNMVAHAGKDFDYPFIIKRMLINDIMPPASLHILNKKPWEIKLMDTKDMWKFGGYRSASLAALCAAFGIQSPKDEITGKEVHAYYHSGKVTNIARYCSNDVRALALVLQRLCTIGRPELACIQIDYV